MHEELLARELFLKYGRRCAEIPCEMADGNQRNRENCREPQKVLFVTERPDDEKMEIRGEPAATKRRLSQYVNAQANVCPLRRTAGAGSSIVLEMTDIMSAE